MQKVTGESLFLNSVSSPYSEQAYKFYLDKYLKICGYDDASELLAKAKDHKEIENEMIAFIISHKEKGMKRAALLNYIKPVISFCKINDCMINNMKINKFMPPDSRNKRTTAYKHEQIAKLLSIADERMSVVILLCCSSGLRIGSIPSLNWGSLREVGDGEIYQITVYKGEAEEYQTFCSSECKESIQNYIAIRERYNEVILPSSPLIREQWDRRDPFVSAHPQRVKKDRLGHKLAELARDIGLRTKTELTEDEKKSHAGASKLKDVPQANGMRRFFCSTLMNSGLQTEMRWLLEGHDLKGNDNSYLKVSNSDLYQSYMLAHDNLLIDQSHKLQKKIAKLEIEASQFERLAAKIASLEQKINH